MVAAATQRAIRSKNLAGVANNSRDIGVGEYARKARHAPSAVDDDRTLLRIVEAIVDLTKGGANGSASIRPMTRRTTGPINLGARQQLCIGVIGKRRFLCTRRDREAETKNDHCCESTSPFVHCANHTEAMGLDPTRQRQKSPFDYVFVGAAICAAIALVIWAVFG